MEKMIDLVLKFPAQLREAIGIGNSAVINKHTQPIRSIFVSGMGGSGIGANFVQELTRGELKIPFVVGKGYEIPNFVGKNTLVIISSYSGNTEETLNALELAIPTGAKIVCVTSGGKIAAKAKELNLDCVILPSGWPSPRACLGFSLTQQLFILNKLKLISNKIIKQLDGAISLLEKNQTALNKEGEKIAGKMLGFIPVIYTTDRMESVAVRFRQQINENSKLLCWHHVVPEQNHNELVGWQGGDKKFLVIYFRSKDDYARNSMRININKKIIGEYTPHIIELWSKGRNLVEQMMYLVHLGDFISCHLCDLRGMDSIEIKVIDYLKSELAKV